MSNKTEKFGDPRKRSVNHSKIQKKRKSSEMYQRNVFRRMIESEPRNIPFYIKITNLCGYWFYPDLGMLFDVEIMKSVLSEKGLI